MAGLIAKWISKKILAEKVENNFGREDPYFETVPATRLDGTPTGKVKKRRKALPPGISKQDGEVLTKVKRRAYRLDQSLFTCCGVKFGWGSVIGLIPATCSKVEGGLPNSVKSKMMFNIIIDFFIGLVPFVGDIADAAFRANTKNAIVLEEYLREKGQKNLRRSGAPIPAVDPSDAEEWDRLQGDRTPPEYVSREPSRNGHMSSSHQNSSTGRPPAPPASAAVREERPTGGGRGWFGFGRSRVDDVESAREPRDRPARQSRR